jgi:hypothetical protein
MSERWRKAAEALLWVGAASLVGAADAPAALPGFAPPLDRPMVLSRTLVRELADGKAIVATRRYRVSFHRTPAGWLIEGALFASEIDAPPALAAIAEIERARPDDGLFPILLDGAGRIVACPGEGDHGRAAVERAAVLGAGRGADPAFLAQINAAAAGGGMTRWPEKLILPGPEHHEDAQEIALPGGAAGVGRVALDRSSADGAATMARAERTVTTELAGTRRVARETWTLTPG